MDDSMDNDTRGWIMCATSGVACVVGACIICVDIPIRYIPGMRNFRIQDSNVFLASSLSLSFGVMLFSALYSMLPSSKKYLIKSGFSPSAAAWVLLAGFMGGFIGIQVVSRFLHHYIPSHVVDCDHSHDEASQKHEHGHSRSHSSLHRHESHGHGGIARESNGNATESTPLIAGDNRVEDEIEGRLSTQPSEESLHAHDRRITRRQTDSNGRRPSMVQVQKRVLSFVKDTKTDCDSSGPCFGYSDPCGQECFKHIPSRTPSASRHTSLLRTATGNFFPPSSKGVPFSIDEEDEGQEGAHRSGRSKTGSSSNKPTSPRSREHQSHESDYDSESGAEDVEAQHHHHVPENSFMSIGLQTSIAIALHKLPEGFITYATNHANPSLGFSVFMALFIHNITEGFAMALPLYLALGSRTWAMFWASLLGGASQPLGAGVAAAWFKIAGHQGHKPGSAVYGCMFAVTAGIMASVALQLFVESLTLNHNRNLCIAFAFIGMAIMGMSNALTS